MKPKHAIKHLRFLVDTQQTISTKRLRKIANKLESHQIMLETDNRKLRQRLRNARRRLKKYEPTN